ncbi:UNKNOWN [Stylonychia lemnae]|uniref:FHA domain-containing protein n=1 Tax=Stylonychia lemnae TaxID=5949 RepID=A0A078AT01_STYLE|nr:UNKNOWN [Stylonychia lemnae]|eukprot:CDW83973.1 UNKNOWN [Stylonychia lemnae]
MVRERCSQFHRELNTYIYSLSLNNSININSLTNQSHMNTNQTEQQFHSDDIMNLLAEIPLIIPKEEIKVAPTLILEVIDSPAQQNTPAYKYYLKKGQQFKINAQGLINSKRNKQDGYVFFGSDGNGGKQEQNSSFTNTLGGIFGNQNKKEVYNDVILGENFANKNGGGNGVNASLNGNQSTQGNFNQGNSNQMLTQNRRQFVVRYKMDTKGYYLKDAGEGSGTFILSNGFLISFGDSHLVVQIQKTTIDLNGQSYTKNKLCLKFLDGPRAQESLYLFSNHNISSTFLPNIKEIKIGRMSDCDIKYKNDASQNWVLYDGQGGNKKSTNGTWVYVDDQFRIYDQMVFRSCNYLFQCKLIDPEFDKNDDNVENDMYLAFQLDNNHHLRTFQNQ